LHTIHYKIMNNIFMCSISNNKSSMFIINKLNRKQAGPKSKHCKTKNIFIRIKKTETSYYNITSGTNDTRSLGANKKPDLCKCIITGNSNNFCIEQGWFLVWKRYTVIYRKAKNKRIALAFEITMEEQTCVWSFNLLSKTMN
jgi:hypothetical protein